MSQENPIGCLRPNLGGQKDKKKIHSLQVNIVSIWTEESKDKNTSSQLCRGNMASKSLVSVQLYFKKSKKSCTCTVQVYLYMCFCRIIKSSMRCQVLLSLTTNTCMLWAYPPHSQAKNYIIYTDECTCTYEIVNP